MPAGVSINEKWITDWLASIPESDFIRDESGVYYALAARPDNGVLCLVRKRYGKCFAMECAVIGEGMDSMTTQAIMQRAGVSFDA